MPPPDQLLPGLYRFHDTCNVYAWTEDGETIAVDYGSGAWRQAAAELGLPPLRHVYLTHAHRDQAAGLEAALPPRDFTIHAPRGEEAFLHPAHLRDFHRARGHGGVRASYEPLATGVHGVEYDMAGFSELFWGPRRLRFLATPGHGSHALSIVATIAGRQVVFCGDAAHAGATVPRPHCLEWDHWTGAGALAAWEGVQRLAGIRVDLLCPGHGPVVTRRARPMLRQLAGRLLAFYQAKGSICPGEPDTYLPPEHLPCGAKRLSPHVYQVGGNGYLLVAADHRALYVDPTSYDLPALGALLAELPHVRLTDTLATHYHCDHCDAMPTVAERYGATTWLHPRVAAPLAPGFPIDCPWLPPEPIVPHRFLPADGTWDWAGYSFRVAPFAAQTWWHCALMAQVDGRRVMLAGDNFQPPSRWNGSGGFCACNGSRFIEGFARSAQLVLDWRPHWLLCGHHAYYRFRPSHFRKIIRWAARAAAATRALCPSGDLDTDYYLHPVD